MRKKNYHDLSSLYQGNSNVFSMNGAHHRLHFWGLICALTTPLIGIVILLVFA